MSDTNPFSVLAPPLKRAEILVCDDDRDTRTIVSHTLRAIGHEVIESESGIEAKERCAKGLPHLIIMDIMMPVFTGLDFLRWFREEVRSRFVPVLMLTALSEVKNRVEGLELGADDYLTKPFHFRELQARVQALLRIKALTEMLMERNEAQAKLNCELASAQQMLLDKERALAVLQLAGAAAHHLGQPITAILLHCRLIERELPALSKPGACRAGEAEPSRSSSDICASIEAIRRECQAIADGLEKMKLVDPQKTSDYIDEMTIVDIQSASKTETNRAK